MRSNSIAEQSSRYCNYSKDKFNNKISVNIPEWVRLNIKETTDYCDEFGVDFIIPTFKELKDEYAGNCPDLTTDDWTKIDWWFWAHFIAEEAYMNLTRIGCKAEEARVVLPLDTHTEIVHTAFESDWKHFIKLRSAKTAHPDIRVLSDEIKKIIK